MSVDICLIKSYNTTYISITVLKIVVKKGEIFSINLIKIFSNDNPETQSGTDLCKTTDI
jgi:hypothetical protein